MEVTKAGAFKGSKCVIDRGPVTLKTGMANMLTPPRLMLSLSKYEGRSVPWAKPERSSLFDRLRACKKIDVWLECNPASFETPAKAGSSG